MIFWVLAYIGGALTILSPCILPVIPFVFSTAEQPFRKSGLPLLCGMALTFAAVATLAVAGGSWVIRANEWGRWLALGMLSLFAMTLLSPTLAEWATRPFTRLGGNLRQTRQDDRSVLGSFGLGVATGFLWAPCAGPILGLVLTGAALRGVSANTSVLLLAYALGAATSLGLALAAGGKLLRGMKRYLGADLWVRRALGVAVLLGALAIALGWDRGPLTRLARLRTETLEQKLIGVLHTKPAEAGKPSPMNILGALSGATGWINSSPLTPASLKGKVVLIDFWTYSCINCLRTLPYVKAWSEKYKSAGLVIIGVHTPEFAFEKNPSNVEKAVSDLGIAYPVAIDNQYAVWNAFNNRYWPAHYFIDVGGMIRHHHFGEGGYEDSEKMIQQLLREGHATYIPSTLVETAGEGALAASVASEVGSPETYLGYNRAENQIAHPAVQRDLEVAYELPKGLQPNQWSLGGTWRIGPEEAWLTRGTGTILYLFNARDVHLVMGPKNAGKSIRFKVTLDGKSPGENHGSDIDAAGYGIVQEQRLYQLIRQKQSPGNHFFQIEFLEPGVQAFAFTFG